MLGLDFIRANRAAVEKAIADKAVTLDLDTPEVPRDDRSDVTFYELMPYLGSSVVF